MGILYHIQRFFYDWGVHRDLKRRCLDALAEGQKARTYWTLMECGPAAQRYAAEHLKYRTFREGTEEHEAWTLGKNGVHQIRITKDFQVKAK